jgi:hypothetical protein
VSREQTARHQQKRDRQLDAATDMSKADSWSTLCCHVPSRPMQRRHVAVPFGLLVVVVAAAVGVVAFAAAVSPVPSFVRRALGSEGGTSAPLRDSCT